MIYLNNIGEFSSLQDVWEKYPYGGKEGDYIVVNGQQIGWDKYTKSWGDNIPPVSPPNYDRIFEEDVTIKGTFKAEGEVDIPALVNIFAHKDDINKKQDTLESGENIKTINGESILGSGNIELGVVPITLDTSKLTVGSYLNITREQFEQIKLARKGCVVTIVNSQNTSQGEWGQIISCYRQYYGSSVYGFRISVIHNNGDMGTSTPQPQLYNIEMMDVSDYTSWTAQLNVKSISNLY